MITLKDFKERKSNKMSVSSLTKEIRCLTIPSKIKERMKRLEYYNALDILKEYFCSHEQEEYTDCNKRTAYRTPIKCIANINGKYCVANTFLNCQLLRENFVNDRLNYYYHSITINSVPNSNMRYWDDREMIFLADQIKNQDKLNEWCKELNDLM